MNRKLGGASLLRRIEELESRTVDSSGFATHSPEWLEFWQRQVHLYDTGTPHAPLTPNAVRAFTQASSSSAGISRDGWKNSKLAPRRLGNR